VCIYVCVYVCVYHSCARQDLYNNVHVGIFLCLGAFIVYACVYLYQPFDGTAQSV